MECFRTSDSSLAAFLITQGHFPDTIDYSVIPRNEIVFSVSNGINALATKYQAGLSSVEPNSFDRILRKLNRTIRAQRQWGEVD